MNKLQCRICGGQIEIQEDNRGICVNCGTAYSLNSMRKMFEGIKVSTTGSSEDVEQWRLLLDKYYAVGDFSEAERIVKKILEAVPDDAQASEKYEQLQVLKHMDIRNGVLTKYSGNAKGIVVPDVVTEIGLKAFSENQQLEEVVLPETITKIGDAAFFGCRSLKKVVLRCGLKSLGYNAFFGSGIESLELPNGLEHIGASAFAYCHSLKRLIIPNSVLDWFSDVINDPVGVGRYPWYECQLLEEIQYPDKFDIRVFSETPFYAKKMNEWREQRAEQARQERQEEQERWRSVGLCQHCGGAFGVFSCKCKKCGKAKDY